MSVTTAPAGTTAGLASPQTATLPDTLDLGAVRLRVTNGERSIAYYTQVIGLTLLERNGNRAVLGAGKRPIVELDIAPSATPRPRGTTGLFHVAILVPDRAALAVVVNRFAAIGVRMGASDHLVSEALYVNDPDGNGIEIYRDRSRDGWEWNNGRIHMETLPLDLRNVMRDLPPGAAVDTPMPDGTVVGHVHLQVGDLASAKKFYVDTLGFAITTDAYPGALFVSAGGYHHHLGLNIWESRGRGPAPKGSVGLQDFAVILLATDEIAAARARLTAAGYATADIPGGFSVADPWDTTLHIVTKG